ENIITSERTRTPTGSFYLLELIFELLYYIFRSYLYKSLSRESAGLQVLFLLNKKAVDTAF
ncbi:hypothetical protein, partial [Bacillus toyonensis]|uniref:hypothetical protein n=1 Tax=Bacillus toyonensis TaxID=155322 RepID=UPI002E1E46A7|nr:hypothetical protein [Bacillus toyonensis]